APPVRLRRALCSRSDLDTLQLGSAERQLGSAERQQGALQKAPRDLPHPFGKCPRHRRGNRRSLCATAALEVSVIEGTRRRLSSSRREQTDENGRTQDPSRARRPSARIAARGLLCWIRPPTYPNLGKR